MKKKLKLTWSTITKSEKWLILIFLVIIPISTLVELLHLLSIVPLVNQLVGSQNTNISFIPYLSGVTVIEAAIIFAFISAVSAFIRYFQNVFLYKTTFNILKTVSCEIYRARILGPYNKVYDNKNSDVFNLFSNKLIYFQAHFLGPILSITQGLFIAILIISMLLIQLTSMFLILMSLVTIIYGTYMVMVRKLTVENSKAIRAFTSKHLELVMNISDYLKEVKLFGLERDSIKKFGLVEGNLRKPQISVQVVAHGSKFIVEATALISIAIAIIVAFNFNEQKIIEKLALLVFSTQKLLPVIQNIYSNCSLVLSGQDMVQEIFEELELGQSSAVVNISTRPPSALKKEITRVNCNQMKFSYQNSTVLKFQNFEFKIGELNCIVGRSGSGKSTLTSLLTNLFKPESGAVNFYSYNQEIPRSKITFSYSAQQPVIFHGSVQDNLIATPVDYETILNVVDLDFLKNIEVIDPKKLSGGERQRLGIARALNVKSDIYIFDEPTASLDEINVKKFVKGILNFSKTNIVVVVSHDEKLISESQNILRLQ
jgi:ABC-type multidrug transport system fused ATPase/permease subunit